LNGNLDFKGLVIVRGTTNVTEVTGSATVWDRSGRPTST
jgi:hypothetical protein